MQVQSINFLTTNPITFNGLSKKKKEEPQQQEKKPIVVNGEVRQDNGLWIGKTTDSKTGEDVIKITKFNWSNIGVLDSTEVTTVPVSNPFFGVKTVNDFEHNAVSKSVIQDPLRAPETKALKTVRTDAKTGKTITTSYMPSDVPGIFNVTESDSDGNSKVITSAVKSPDGAVRIVKNMTSLDGTTTTYRYSKDASGNHIKMFNQITDKNGEVLSTIDRTYDRVDDTLAFSSVNGRHYTIEHDDEYTIVTDEFKGEKTVLSEKTFKVPLHKKPMIDIIGKAAGYNPEKTKEPVINEMLHTLPGDALLKMNEDVKYIVPIKDNLDSAFIAFFGILNCNTDEFVISHELGHSQDSYLNEEAKQINKEIEQAAKEGKEIPEYYQNPLADNPQFVKEYVQEKAAFVEAFPSFQEEYIDYFIFETDGQADRGRKETIAETNAINSQKPMPLEMLAMRTQVLQQYFPRTIAAATRLMNPIAIPDEENQEKEIIVPEKEIIVPESGIIVPERKIILA